MRARCLSLLSLTLLACGDDQPAMPDSAPMPDATDYTIGDHPQLAVACTDTLADVYNLPSNLPAMDDSHRGDVFRCAISENSSVSAITILTSE